MSDDAADTVPDGPIEDPKAAARRRVFESLPAEAQANPKIRRDFGIDPPEAGVGLGDLVERVARPVAKLLGLQDCGGCKARQKRWNRVRLLRGPRGGNTG